MRKVTDHPGNQDDIFRPPRLRAVSEELQFPRARPPQHGIDPIAVTLKVRLCLLRKHVKLRFSSPSPVHAAEKDVNPEWGIACIE